MNVANIVEAINAGRVVRSRHGLREAAIDNLTLDEIYDSVVRGEIIEDYPDAYPLPACLVLGWNESQNPIHSVWAYNQNTQTAKLVTVYRPNAERWTNWRIRK